MKIILTEEPTYTAKVGDHTVSGLRVKSEWNGFLELVNHNGEIVIVGCGMRDVERSGFAATFDALFETKGPLRTIEGVIINASPSLHEKFKPAQSDSA